MGTDPIFQEDKHPVLCADRVGDANTLVELFIEIKQRISLSQYDSEPSKMIQIERWPVTSDDAAPFILRRTVYSKIILAFAANWIL